ncbi:hypothetical protein [Nocardia aurantia]|uniref:hypothetical protein n=1 Tax=Nocardia aurantia TaxID=2585199 RepID=UPI00129697A9|nr:hypothetical protein [Nocardia aurantia]
MVVVILALTRNSGSHTAAPVPPTPPLSAALSCPSRVDGAVTIGNGAGGTDSGTAAILGFQHGFYSERSGAVARSFVAPDAANVSTPEIIQKAIDEQIPRGTTYCLRVEQLAGDRYNVDLTEHRPDGTTTVYRQQVSTVVRDNKNLIYAINER